MNPKMKNGPQVAPPPQHVGLTTVKILSRFVLVRVTRH